MRMRYKGLDFDCKDHPDGLATLIIANNCTHGCKKCINKHLLDAESRITDIDAQVDYILANTISKCIVLGGLEWTEQEEEMYALLDACKRQGANVILYTHWTEYEIRHKFPKLLTYDIYIKFGKYNKKYLSQSHTSYGIPLATQNQYIKKFDRAHPDGL